MSLEHSIWRVGEKPTRLHETRLPSEFDLEEMICHDPAILSEDWMLIGRQVVTDFGKRVDLLGIDQLGSLIVVELKRDRTPRDVIAQALEYAGWVQRLKSDEVAEIFGRFVPGNTSLDQAFRARFNADLDEDVLNASHQIVVVATRMDPQTERIVQYLNDSSVPINFVSFRVFEDNGESYLSRAWFIDPGETQQKSQAPRSPDRQQEPWNGETYVSFGPQESRHWDDARKYGFVSAGGKRWYSRTLFKLEPGDRIWANVSGHGYAGVGRVTEAAQKMDEFEVDTPEGRRSITDVPLNAHYHQHEIEDEDRAEYFVRVEWIKTVELANAVKEVGLFGNQNTVCKPTAPKWSHTIKRLKARFGIED